MTVLEVVKKEKPPIFYCYDITGRMNRCALNDWTKYESYNYFKDKQVVKYGNDFNFRHGYGFHIYCK